MKKIKTLFKIDRITHLATPEVTEGCEWVINGEGIATEKFNGTACMIRDGKLFKRYDRKAIDKEFTKFKDAPEGWEPCQDAPDLKTGHWPGWVSISETAPQDQYHREAFAVFQESPRLMVSLGLSLSMDPPLDGTYELIGEKIEGNPYKLPSVRSTHLSHILIKHGNKIYRSYINNLTRDFEGLKQFLLDKNSEDNYMEGIVWYRENGDMAKIRLKDFTGER